MALRRKHKIAIALLSLTVVLLAGGISFMLKRHVSHIQTADTAAYPINGIDISAHNGNVDLKKAKASGVGFVIIKASEGESFRDSLFERNYRQATEAGLEIGAYHFFRFDVDGISQAHNFLNAVAGKQFSLPLTIDVENHTNPYTPFPETVTRELRNMVDALAARKYPVMIYTNKKGFDNLIRDQFKDCHLWICTFSQPDDSLAWILWQHSHRGHVDGIEGRVDLDIFNGDSAQWAKWTEQTKAQFKESTALFSQ